MEAAKSIGSIIEWNQFKKLVTNNYDDLVSLRIKSGHQAKKIKILERQLENYRIRDDEINKLK